MATQYIDPMTKKPMDLSKYGDIGAQNIQANKMGYDIAPVIPAIGSEFGSKLTSAVSGNIPSTSLGAPDTTASTFNLRKQYEDLFAGQKAQQEAFIAATAPTTQETAQETALTNQLNTMNDAARKAIFAAEQSGDTQRFAAGEAGRVARQASIEIQGVVDQINSLVGRRQQRIDAITTTMKFNKENMDALTNLSKLTQPDVLSTGTDKKTGEIYSIVKDPMTGEVTQKIIGRVTPEEAKLDLLKTYTDASGNEVASFLDPTTNTIVNKVLGKTGVGAGVTELSSNLMAYAQRLASEGKLPTPAEAKAAGLTVGQVSEAAKSLPKPKGALVNMHTGVVPTNLSAEETKGIVALNEIVGDTLPRLKELFPKLYTGLVGGVAGAVYTTQDRQDYNTFKQEFLSKLLVARSGAAVTEQEYARYAAMLPGTFNQMLFLGSDGLKKLESLDKTMNVSLKNKLDTTQTAIYGYTPVKIGDKEYKVGDVIEVNGIQGHILPDGSIAVN